MEKLVVWRFDFMAKYLYIWAKDMKINSTFFQELYHKHILVFNNCWECSDPLIGDKKTKKGINDFLQVFNNLIVDMKKNGFNEKYPIPLGNNGLIINGTHRFMTAYYYNIEPVITKINGQGGSWNYKFFNRLDRVYADTMALEYIKHNKNIRIMIVWPIAYDKYVEKNNDFNSIVKKYGRIYYDKSNTFMKRGVRNLIEECYRGESWIGGLFPNGSGGANMKCNYCYKDKPTTLFLIDMNDLNKCIEFKEKCRELLGLGKHSLHTSDFTKDTFRIASAFLNKNSLNLLDSFKGINSNTCNLLIKYFDIIKEKKEDYCLTSSLILEMYGLRNAKDIDYLNKYDNEILCNNIGLHKGKWLSYYHIHKDEIIYNPKYHFYFNGYKFASLDVIKIMKQNRNEEKDKNDLKLIKGMI